MEHRRQRPGGAAEGPLHLLTGAARLARGADPGARGVAYRGRMTQVMAVQFSPHGQLHYLDPGDERYRTGEAVLYPTEFGPEVCRVVWAPELIDAEGFGALPACAGRAQPDDLRRDRRNARLRAEALAVTRELVARHNLPMKLVGVDYIDRSDEFDQQVVVYYTAPIRVDFRALLGDLARTLQARIDLRQVGSRDATRISGGVGDCGRELCCSTFLDSFEPVSMRLAKAQGLTGNPLQIAGACGRLKCCLRYEQPLYTDFAERAPDLGARVLTPSGEGTVVAHSVPLDAVSVRTADGEVSLCPLASVCPVVGRDPAPRRTLLRRRHEGDPDPDGETRPRPGPRRLPLPIRPRSQAGESGR